ncbi:MAG: QueT transporter family protein [Deltaproteobacteria bacterium]|nr:QueT transporter family protein [Deltaproteobacteria bacterium]MBI3078339.1 QueT transporter family protein [Deltaproteobacteria bacterium]
MRELVTMWKYTKMVVLTALTAAVYAAVLIPLKGIPLIPGFTEVRPANAIPVTFSFLFGPAAAWGSAIGNLIADFFGTLGPGSLFGFLGNFFFGLVGYKLHGRMGLLGARTLDESARGRLYIEFVLIAILASLICATTIGWGADLLGLLPFAVLAGIIALNNTLAAVVLGPVLLWLLLPRVRRWDLLWDEIMDPADRPAPRLAWLGVVCLWIGGTGGMAAGLLASGGQPLPLLGTNPGVATAVLPFLFLVTAGCLLL